MQIFEANLNIWSLFINLLEDGLAHEILIYIKLLLECSWPSTFVSRSFFSRISDEFSWTHGKCRWQWFFFYGCLLILRAMSRLTGFIVIGVYGTAIIMRIQWHGWHRWQCRRGRFSSIWVSMEQEFFVYFRNEVFQYICLWKKKIFCQLPQSIFSIWVSTEWAFLVAASRSKSRLAIWEMRLLPRSKSRLVFFLTMLSTKREFWIEFKDESSWAILSIWVSCLMRWYCCHFYYIHYLLLRVRRER